MFSGLLAVLVPYLLMALVDFFAFRSLMNLRYHYDLKFLDSFFVRMPVIAIALVFPSNIGLVVLFSETVDRFLEFRVIVAWLGSFFLFIWLLASSVLLLRCFRSSTPKS